MLRGSGGGVGMLLVIVVSIIRDKIEIRGICRYPVLAVKVRTNALRICADERGLNYFFCRSFGNNFGTSGCWKNFCISSGSIFASCSSQYAQLWAPADSWYS